MSPGNEPANAWPSDPVGSTNVWVAPPELSSQPLAMPSKRAFRPIFLRSRWRCRFAALAVKAGAPAPLLAPASSASEPCESSSAAASGAAAAAADGCMASRAPAVVSRAVQAGEQRVIWPHHHSGGIQCVLQGVHELQLPDADARFPDVRELHPHAAAALLANGCPHDRLHQQDRGIVDDVDRLAGLHGQVGVQAHQAVHRGGRQPHRPQLRRLAPQRPRPDLLPHLALLRREELPWLLRQHHLADRLLALASVALLGREALCNSMRLLLMDAAMRLQARLRREVHEDLLMLLKTVFAQGGVAVHPHSSEHRLRARGEGVLEPGNRVLERKTIAERR
mmetsp:Transcript_2096/g.5962  ORF Transcript_2096/g.5962 Transcript_2096/m.5962 type:complete len:337 (+) Transcript_2096:2155-3165(+)